MLGDHPELIHSKYGSKEETLLHRLSQELPRALVTNEDLFRACRYGNRKAFDFLISRGAVLAARNNYGSTPLHLASRFGRLDMIQVSGNQRPPQMSLVAHFPFLPYVFVSIAYNKGDTSSVLFAVSRHGTPARRCQI